MKARTIKKELLDQDELVRMVEEKLKASAVGFTPIPHAPEGNCEKVSELRGNPVHAAAKALLLSIKVSNKHSRCVLAILPGDKKVDFDAIKKAYGVKSATMADRSKVEELLQCEIGRVPPFSFSSSVEVIVDAELVNDNEAIYFSPGRLDLSFKMAAEDYRKMILADKGKIFAFSSKMDSAYQAGVTMFAKAEVKAAEEAPTQEVSTSYTK